MIIVLQIYDENISVRVNYFIIILFFYYSLLSTCKPYIQINSENIEKMMLRAMVITYAIAMIIID
jgi:hypothetical protein